MADHSLPNNRRINLLHFHGRPRARPCRYRSHPLIDGDNWNRHPRSEVVEWDDGYWRAAPRTRPEVHHRSRCPARRHASRQFQFAAISIGLAATHASHQWESVHSCQRPAAFLRLELIVSYLRRLPVGSLAKKRMWPGLGRRCMRAPRSGGRRQSTRATMGLSEVVLSAPATRRP
jgi:hypothetical protein